MLRMWDVWDVRSSGCSMWDVGWLQECGMLIYKMPYYTCLDKNKKNVILKKSHSYVIDFQLKYSRYIRVRLWVKVFVS